MLFFILFGNFVQKFHFPFVCRPIQVSISCSVQRLHKNIAMAKTLSRNLYQCLYLSRNLATKPKVCQQIKLKPGIELKVGSIRVSEGFN